MTDDRSALMHGSGAIIDPVEEMETAPELRRIAELPIEERADALEELVGSLELDLEKTKAHPQVPEPTTS